jgi:hypothetical protein
MTTNFVAKLRHGMWPTLRVTEPVRQIDTKTERRKRIAALSKVVNALHKDTLARLAK